MGDGPNVFFCLSTQTSVEYLGIYINRVTPNLTKVSVEKTPIFCEVTYYIEIFQFLVFATKPEVIFRILIRYFRDQFMTILRSHIPNFKSLCHLVRSTDSFKINKGYIAKKLPKSLKIAITRSNLKISKYKKLRF